jgi:hypothetical protein
LSRNCFAFTATSPWKRPTRSQPLTTFNISPPHPNHPPPYIAWPPFFVPRFLMDWHPRLLSGRQ